MACRHVVETRYESEHYLCLYTLVRNTDDEGEEDEKCAMRLSITARGGNLYIEKTGSNNAVSAKRAVCPLIM